MCCSEPGPESVQPAPASGAVVQVRRATALGFGKVRLELACGHHDVLDATVDDVRRFRRSDQRPKFAVCPVCVVDTIFEDC